MDAFQSWQPFQPYLFQGERILWTGRPKRGIAFARSDLLAIPFSLVWGGFAILWNFDVWTGVNTGTSFDWSFRLWGLPFLIAGLYLIAGRFFVDAWIRGGTYYAITTERVLTLRSRPTSKFTSRDIQALPMFELSEHRDGTGTIVFDSDDVGYGLFRHRGFNIWTPAASANAQFFRIENPRRAYELIRNASRS